MQILYRKSFKKSYRKLKIDDKEKVNEAILRFRENPYNPILKNHALTGEMNGLRAISAGFDLRIVFQELNKHYVVYLIDVGTHNQVY